MLDQAFDALKTYDWGVDPKVLSPIDEAINSSHGDAKARGDLEKRLVAVLGSDVPQAAKDAVCRALKTVGTAASVPALAKLLADEKLSHMARYALEAIPGQEATKALLAALHRYSNAIKIGISSSLGARKEAGFEAALAALLVDKDPAVVRSGALALGAIGSNAAAAALSAANPTDASAKAAIADGLLDFAETVLAAGNKTRSNAVYKTILAKNPSESVKIAAELGVKASS